MVVAKALCKTHWKKEVVSGDERSWRSALKAAHDTPLIRCRVLYILRVWICPKENEKELAFWLGIDRDGGQDAWVCFEIKIVVEAGGKLQGGVDPHVISIPWARGCLYRKARPEIELGGAKDRIYSRPA